MKAIVHLLFTLFICLNFTQINATPRPNPNPSPKPISQTVKFSFLPDDILGVWMSPEKDGQVQFYKKNGKYFGKVVWSIHDRVGQPKLDTENPVVSMRNRRVVGIDVFSNLEYTNNKWENGTAYDARTGYTFSASLYLETKDIMKLRGYLGFSLLGKTVTMNRVK